MGVGAQHCSLGLHALWGLRAAGVVGGRPRGGWPATVVRGVWCQALSLPQPPVLWSGQPGFRDPCVPGAVGAGVGTQHRPHGVRPCGARVARRGGGGRASPGGGAVRRCEGRLGSGATPPPAARPALVWGVRGRALSNPRPLVRSGVRLGPTTHWLWVRGVRAWGPVTKITARALACCGGGMRVPGGGASCLGVGRPGTGALPPPTSRPFRRAAGVHHLLAVGPGAAGVGTRHQPHSARPCALLGRHEGARGGRLLPGCGASGDGRSPTPDLSFVRACGRAHYPLAVGAGGAGVGTRLQPHSARSCVLWVAA